MKNLLLIFLFAGVGCASGPANSKNKIAPNLGACTTTNGAFGASDPSPLYINTEKLLALTEWVKKNHLPILSITASKNGKVFYNLATSALDANSAHYLMSVTKSFTSALMGVVIDRHLVASVDTPVASLLPKSYFGDEKNHARFENLSVREVLGMSALDAPVWPHVATKAAHQRLNEFMAAENRAQFALTQPLLHNPGEDFQYTDVTPAIAAGIIENAAHETMLELANETLFGPMGFQNQEWMHEDRSGIDNGAFGLRLRPIDMQKFGVLYLNHGCWDGQQLLSSEWVERSFTPWIRSATTKMQPDYGWYWWNTDWGNGWNGHLAAGWKGQRIGVFPEKNVVITLTALFDRDDLENEVFGKLVQYFASAVDEPPAWNAEGAALDQKLKEEIEAVRVAPSRISDQTEARMIPANSNKEHHHSFLGAD
jgi:CubicO group peptidase (beta-lactamase class C family)